MEWPETDPRAKAEFGAVADELEKSADVKRVKMMGMPSLKTGGRMFAGLYGEAMTFKLAAGSEAHDAALALDGAKLFEPPGSKRPMKEWVQVPVAHAKRWPEFARIALRYATG